MGAINEHARRFLESRGIVLPQGISLPIRGVDQEFFAVRTPRVSEELYPRVYFESQPIDLPDGGLTNSYEIIIAHNSSSHLEVRSVPTPQFMHKILKDLRVHAIINGGFFYLADEHDKGPHDASFNFCVRDGALVSLPVINRAVIIQTHNGIEGKMIRAVGTMRIDSKPFLWIGALEYGSRDMNILFNSACCHIERGYDPNKRVQPRVLNKENNRTPNADRRTDIVVRMRDDGVLHVQDICNGGGTDFFSGNFILNVPKENAAGISIGDIVHPETLDDLRLDAVESAITVGPSLEEGIVPDLDTLSINNDPSLANKPFQDIRTARSIIYRTNDGSIHLRIFDGARDSKTFKGITPRETYDIIYGEYPNKIEWAFHLDGSQSARAVFRRAGSFEPYGNLHYARWPWKGFEDQTRYFLDPWRGRKTASVLCVVKNEE